VERNFRRTTGTRQPRLRFAVAADNRGIKITKAINLRCAKKADIDATSLQPIRKNFW